MDAWHLTASLDRSKGKSPPNRLPGAPVACPPNGQGAFAGAELAGSAHNFLIF